MLHLGMADGWDFYTVERFAFKEGFTSSWSGMTGTGKGYYCLIKDEADKTADDMTEAEGKGMWRNMPVGLSTSLDADEVAKKSMEIMKLVSTETNFTPGKSSEKDVDHTEPRDATSNTNLKKRVNVVPHHEAGSYCCGFIYYESLATKLRRRNRKTQVLFSHVPGESDETSLKNGRDAILAIISAACDQMVNRRGIPTAPSFSCN